MFRKSGRVEIEWCGWIQKKEAAAPKAPDESFRKKAQIVDMGLGGASLELEDEGLINGEHFVLFLVPPDLESSKASSQPDSSSTIELECEVRWAKPPVKDLGNGGGEGRWRFGVVFLEVPPEVTAKLAVWLSSIPRIGEI